MTDSKSTQKQVQDDELLIAKKTIQTLVSAFKSFSLYPEDHVFCRTNLEKFKAQLETFLEVYEELPVAIVKNSFVYEGETVFDAPPEENNPAYLLTRDGLVRLHFIKGIEYEEIATFLRILNQYRGGGDDAGGDIVTAFWQAEFEHLEYEEVDIFALEGFSFELGALQVSPADAPLRPPDDQEKTDSESETQETEEQQSLARNETVTNLLQFENTLKVLELSEEEKKILHSYVVEEEQRDFGNDIVDILLIILISQKNKPHFVQVLEFLDSVFFDLLNRGDFHLAHKLCSNILTIKNQVKAIRPWIIELVDRFLHQLSAEEAWAELSWVRNTHLLVLHQKRIDYLFKVLKILPPDIMLALGPLMGRLDMENIHLRNELHELIENNAIQDPDKLGELMGRSDENTTLMLFPIVEHLSRMDAAAICLQMTRHEDVAVRKTGLNGYFTYTSSPDFEALSHLMADEDGTLVAKLLSRLLSLTEKEEAEAILLGFLEQALTDGTERDHTFEFYKALSQCGSFKSVRLLEKVLLESKLTDMFSNMNAVHKKGSALALKIIGTEDALKVLQKGVKSLRPDIRFACQFALEKVK